MSGKELKNNPYKYESQKIDMNKGDERFESARYMANPRDKFWRYFDKFFKPKKNV